MKKRKDRLAKENELLLREVHHRVKNNFQIIISLIDLLANQHPKNRHVFIDLINRIKSMSLTYENLLVEKNLGYIKLEEYIKLLVNNVEQTCAYNIDFHLKFDLSGENAFLSLEQATPLGISINELVSNICKHAFNHDDFRDRENNEADIIVTGDKSKIDIDINDNGIGIDEKFIEETSNTLGLNLTKMLIKEQLDGHIYFKKDEGTKIHISFDVLKA